MKLHLRMVKAVRECFTNLLFQCDFLLFEGQQQVKQKILLSSKVRNGRKSCKSLEDDESDPDVAKQGKAQKMSGIIGQSTSTGETYALSQELTAAGKPPSMYPWK